MPLALYYSENEDDLDDLIAASGSLARESTAHTEASE